MLMNDFYTVRDLQYGEASLHCSITYDPLHRIFAGHFPGQPVVPGACTLQMVGELLRQATGKALHLQKAAQVKYLRLVTPELTPVFSLQWQQQDGQWSVTAVLRDGDTDLFKLSGAVFSAA